MTDNLCLRMPERPHLGKNRRDAVTEVRSIHPALLCQSALHPANCHRMFSIHGPEQYTTPLDSAVAPTQLSLQVLTTPVSAVPALFATVRARPGPFRPPKIASSALEAVLTGRNGPGRARTVANRAGNGRKQAGTALTGAVRTGLHCRSRAAACGRRGTGQFIWPQLVCREAAASGSSVSLAAARPQGGEDTTPLSVCGRSRCPAAWDRSTQQRVLCVCMCVCVYCVCCPLDRACHTPPRGPSARPAAGGMTRADVIWHHLRDVIRVWRHWTSLSGPVRSDCRSGTAGRSNSGHAVRTCITVSPQDKQGYVLKKRLLGNMISTIILVETRYKMALLQSCVLL